MVIPPCSVIRVLGASRLFVVTNIILDTRNMIVSVRDVITISAGMLRIGLVDHFLDLGFFKKDHLMFPQN